MSPGLAGCSHTRASPSAWAGRTASPFGKAPISPGLKPSLYQAVLSSLLVSRLPASVGKEQIDAPCGRLPKGWDTPAKIQVLHDGLKTIAPTDEYSQHITAPIRQEVQQHVIAREGVGEGLLATLADVLYHIGCGGGGGGAQQVEEEIVALDEQEFLKSQQAQLGRTNTDASRRSYVCASRSGAQRARP